MSTSGMTFSSLSFTEGGAHPRLMEWSMSRRLAAGIVQELNRTRYRN
jgi:hypothetical protein